MPSSIPSHFYSCYRLKKNLVKSTHASITYSFIQIQIKPLILFPLAQLVTKNQECTFILYVPISKSNVSKGNRQNDFGLSILHYKLFMSTDGKNTSISKIVVI